MHNDLLCILQKAGGCPGGLFWVGKQKFPYPGVSLWVLTGSTWACNSEIPGTNLYGPRSGIRYRKGAWICQILLLPNLPQYTLLSTPIATPFHPTCPYSACLLTSSVFPGILPELAGLGQSAGTLKVALGSPPVLWQPVTLHIVEALFAVPKGSWYW